MRQICTKAALNFWPWQAGYQFVGHRGPWIPPPDPN